jgi:hypothetical protein
MKAEYPGISILELAQEKSRAKIAIPVRFRTPPSRKRSVNSENSALSLSVSMTCVRSGVARFSP